MAIHAVGVKASALLLASAVPFESKLIAFLTLGVVFAVFARNYVVMHAIDNRDRDDDHDYLFVDSNTGWADITERVFRALIVGVVVVSPKNAIPPLSKLITDASSSIVQYIRYAMELIPDFRATMDSASPGLFFLVSYYGAVLFILFICCFLWDIVNVVAFSIRNRYRRRQSMKIVDKIYKGELETILYYVRGKSYKVPENIQNADYNFSILKLYFTSAKFVERLSGLLVSLSMLGLSASYGGPLMTLIWTAFTIMYGLAAWRNKGYFLSFVEFGTMWLHYALRRSRQSSETQSDTKGHPDET